MNVTPRQFIRQTGRTFLYLNIFFFQYSNVTKRQFIIQTEFGQPYNLNKKCFPILKRQFIKQTEFGQYYQLNKIVFHYSNAQTGHFIQKFPKQLQLLPKTCLPQTMAIFPQNSNVTQRQFIKQTKCGQSYHLKIFPQNPFPQTTAIFPKNLNVTQRKIY